MVAKAKKKKKPKKKAQKAKRIARKYLQERREKKTTPQPPAKPTLAVPSSYPRNFVPVQAPPPIMYGGGGSQPIDYGRLGDIFRENQSVPSMNNNDDILERLNTLETLLEKSYKNTIPVRRNPQSTSSTQTMPPLPPVKIKKEKNTSSPPVQKGKKTPSPPPSPPSGAYGGHIPPPPSPPPIRPKSPPNTRAKDGDFKRLFQPSKPPKFKDSRAADQDAAEMTTPPQSSIDGMNEAVTLGARFSDDGLDTPGKKQKPAEQMAKNVPGETPSGDFVSPERNFKRQATTSGYSEEFDRRIHQPDADKTRFFRDRPPFQDPNAFEEDRYHKSDI